MQTIEEILDFIKRKSVNLKKVSEESGISYDKLASWRQERGKPKVEDTETLLEWWKKRPENALKLEEIPNSLDRMPTEENHNSAEESSTIQAILKIANANEKLADSNQRLTAMLEKERAITATSPQQNLEAVESTIQNLQELLIEVALGKQFSSRQEVNALLNTSKISTFQK